MMDGRRRSAATTGQEGGRPDLGRNGAGGRAEIGAGDAAAGQTVVGISEPTGRRAMARAPTEPFLKVA